MEKLDRINGVTFDWNNLYRKLNRATKGKQVGLIAQEVEREFPELVSKWDKENYRAVDYGRFTAVLLEGIKELHTQNKKLSQENSAIKQEISALQQAVIELRSVASKYR